MRICSGNGYCLDGLHGNGTCVCNVFYTGRVCERTYTTTSNALLIGALLAVLFLGVMAVVIWRGRVWMRRRRHRKRYVGGRGRGGEANSGGGGS